MLYRAPELFDINPDSHIDERVDVWSLGCLLYATLFLTSPFEQVKCLLCTCACVCNVCIDMCVRVIVRVHVVYMRAYYRARGCVESGLPALRHTVSHFSIWAGKVSFMCLCLCVQCMYWWDRAGVYVCMLVYACMYCICTCDRARRRVSLGCLLYAIPFSLSHSRMYNTIFVAYLRACVCAQVCWYVCVCDWRVGVLTVCSAR